MDKQEQLKEALKELFAAARGADNHISAGQIAEVCGRLSLDERQKELLCAYLERNHLTVEGVSASGEGRPEERMKGPLREEGPTGEDAVSFQTYIKEIQSVRPWREQEEAGLIEALKNGDRTARERLIEGNLHLVVQKAQEYLGRGVLAADLVQEGNLALLSAMDSWDKKENLEAHLTAAVENAMEAAIQGQAGADGIGLYLAEDANALMKAMEVLAEELEREATAEELADYLHISPKRVQALVKISLDAMKGSDE